jgi:hypothetical protein
MVALAPQSGGFVRFLNCKQKILARVQRTIVRLVDFRQLTIVPPGVEMCSVDSEA